MSEVIPLDFERRAARNRVPSSEDEQPPEDIESTARRFLSAPKNPKYQQWVLRFYSRNYQQYFQPGQWAVLTHILDQTVSAGRDTWGFSYRKISNGDSKTDGIGYSKRQLQRLVDQLEGMGVIHVVRNTHGLQVTPNISWKPPEGMPLASESRRKRHVPGRSAKIETGCTENRPRRWDDSDVTRDKTCTSDTHVTPGSDTHVTPLMTPMSPIRGEDVGGEELREEAGSPRIAIAMVGGSPFEKENKTASPKENIIPPVPAAPPFPAVDGSMEAKSIARTLRRAFSLDYPDTPIDRWPDVQRTAVARCIAHNWAAKEAKNWPEHEVVGACHGFADWLVASWAEINRRVEAPDFPTSQFIARYSKWLIAEYTSFKSPRPPMRKGGAESATVQPSQMG